MVDPDVSQRPSAREALQHNWFKTVFPNMTNLIPANEIATPKNRRIEPLSASFDQSTKNISREKVNAALKKDTENKGLWQEAVNSPIPSQVQTFLTKLPKLATSHPTTPQKQTKDVTFTAYAVQATSLQTTPNKQSKNMNFRKQSTLPSSNSSTSNKSNETSEEEKQDDKRRRSYEIKAFPTKNSELRFSQLSNAGKLVMANSPQKKSGLSKQVKSTNKKSNARNSSKVPKRISQENLKFQLDGEKSPDLSPQIEKNKNKQKKAAITPIFIK